GRALLPPKLAATHSVSTFVQKTVRRDLLRSCRGASKLDRESIPDIVVPSFLVETGDATHDHDHPSTRFVGALQPHKGLGPLLAAYERLDNPPPLVLIGSVWPETPKQFPP